MCRLFAMSGGPRAVQATFWLLDAPHSLASQSRREPDGTGLGYFTKSDRPRIEKLPKLEERLGADRGLVKGETDSERVFALITKLAAENGGALDRAIADAANW